MIFRFFAFKPNKFGVFSTYLYLCNHIYRKFFRKL